MHYIEDNYIDKSKIKEKIDSLKKIEETMEKLFPEGTVNSWVIKGQIDILQDLLEESEWLEMAKPYVSNWYRIWTCKNCGGDKFIVISYKDKDKIICKSCKKKIYKTILEESEGD